MSSILVITYEDWKSSVVKTGLNYYWKRSVDEQSQVPFATNQHFVGKFAPTQFTYLQGLRQNPALDIPAIGPQPPQPVSFVGKFSQTQFTYLLNLRQNASLDIIPAVQLDAPVNFIGKFSPTTFSRQLGYVQNMPMGESGPLPLQPETNVNFIGLYRSTQLACLAVYRQNTANDISTQVQPATNRDFVGKFAPVSYNYLLGLRQNTANDSSSQIPVDTNQDFIAWFTPTQFSYLQILRENPSVDVPAFITPLDNQHFVSKFSPLTFARQLGYVQNIPSDVQGPLGPQADANTHFVGKYAPTAHVFLAGLRQNPAIDFVISAFETNQHFVGKFAATSYKYLLSLRQTTAADSSSQVPLATNQHFIGNYRPTSLVYLALQRQNRALDVPRTIETNQHFIGKFLPTTFNFFRYNYAGCDFSGPLAPQPSTPVNFIRKFQQTVYTRAFQYNLRDTTELSVFILPPRPLIPAPWWPNTSIAGWPGPNENQNWAAVESAFRKPWESHPLLVDTNKFDQQYYCIGLTPVGCNTTPRARFNKQTITVPTFVNTARGVENKTWAEIQSGQFSQFISDPLLVDTNRFEQQFYCIGLTPVGGNVTPRGVFNNAIRGTGVIFKPLTFILGQSVLGGPDVLGP